MTLRTLPFFGAAMMALLIAGEASAQTYRVAPEYGYRGNNAYGDDDEDYPGASPGTYGQPAQPHSERRPYDQPPPGYGQRRDPGYTGSLPPQGVYRQPLPPSDVTGSYAPPREAPQRPYADNPPEAYELPPQPAYGRAAPSDGMRPPADLGGRAPAGRQQPQQNADDDGDGSPDELAPRLRRQIVNYPTKEPAGTLIVDTSNTYLYLVMEGGKAMRYGIGVGREGFTWAGRERVSRMKEWPDWYPPAEMIERQPYLPRWMAGGASNPLGARALYLGSTVYRIHGTNSPKTIGTFVSSGCIRLINADIEDLYSRVQVGTQVVVLPGKSVPAAQNGPPANTQPQTRAAPAAPQNPRAAQNMTPRPPGSVSR